MRLSDLSQRRDPEQRGLICPRCGCRHLPVVYTRPKPGCILRVRKCRYCGKRLSTQEK